jgi:hypothetical protein
MITNKLESSLTLPRIKKAWSNWLTASKVMSLEREVELKVAKTGRTWKFRFCRDMSLDFGVPALSHPEK